ncbi:C45 family autoproteolytic acyltransferase/hydolase [Capnocytophaga catalasegens]|uniref:Acyl-CoA--6-aminopenicillanic acid acyl-transferase n=1 Tax=Capnocytophaga catalasegens TaxID=1004260 RepID=A0AAV5B061_9FLAO|nr:C45 family peptidase [Capnocytophaga catalasegens]GIZ14383.1 acyl-CoA--6-aminopenicillanic acid acyl-transferase [Capnocytophaga catalasegens]GJM51503.1 acyl-CoA--6-aminopenicillanic acid acyl-transferase [Capnocytophaga catalasegens]GJM53407.1 acyl-CoA--6-aminopenicillanic acid acyl-transferase [Capnocytophaga catalasegens]
MQLKFCYILLLLFTSCGVIQHHNTAPNLKDYSVIVPQIEVRADTLRTFGKDYVIRNKHKMWELYASGNPYQLGLSTGALLEPLYHRQDSIFFQKINNFVPSLAKQKLLRIFLTWFMKELPEHIIEPYRVELYGVSRYGSSRFDFIAPAYARSMYLHATHDLGHALSDLALVGCSSLAVWGDKTADGKMLLGRNLDFYIGDDFAQNKVVHFITPTEGIPFASVSWAGMIGVLSGMNLSGLTITINTGKSDLPFKAKTPISLLCREILQYASTTEQAIEIARKRSIFVSESIMISSIEDGKVVLIEISPKKIDVFQVNPSKQALICTNHFQSDTYQNDKNNLQQMQESHSVYRYKKLEELIKQNKTITPEIMASILRNTEGLAGENIGYGNEKALNQLLAHHAVIFKPEDRLMWVSTNPYQLGEFVAYDLQEIFSKNEIVYTSGEKEDLSLPADDFLQTQTYEDYQKYRIEEQVLQEAISQKKKISQEQIHAYQKLNPNLWKVYAKVGEYYYSKGWYRASYLQFQQALSKEIPSTFERKKIEKKQLNIQRKIHIENDTRDRKKIKFRN